MIVDSYQQLLRLVGTPEYNQIVEIDIQGEHLENLPNPLPISLRVLFCSYNQLTSLPSLPASLGTLYCSYNQLTSLPPLPANLQRLDCHNNQLTSLPSLQASLLGLYCHDNQLTSLPFLPSSLQDLYCRSNQLTSLPSLPVSLQTLSCYDNLLPFTGISNWKLLTRIRRQLYLPAIVKLQRRWRQRKQFQVFKEELVERIYHPDNLRQAQDAGASPCGPAKQVGQTWMEARY